jgi:hypothetical protein
MPEYMLVGTKKYIFEGNNGLEIFGWNGQIRGFTHKKDDKDVLLAVGMIIPIVEMAHLQAGLLFGHKSSTKRHPSTGSSMNFPCLIATVGLEWKMCLTGQSYQMTLRSDMIFR